MNKIILGFLVCFSSTLFAQTWEQLGDAPVGRHHPVSFSIDGKGYAITGTDINGNVTNIALEYDPQTDTWTTLEDFPGTERGFAMGVVNNDIAYLGFGVSSFSYLNDLWSFDPSTSDWEELASCPCSGRRHPAMLSLGDKIYVGMGNDLFNDLDEWWMYDITNDSWTQLDDLPGDARHHPFMFNAGGELFAGMGHGGPVIYDDWYKLDTLTNTWIEVNSFPGEARVAGTQFDHNGFGYVLSGDGDNHGPMESGEMWQYEPETDTWKEFPAHPGNSLWAPGSFVIDNDVYFFGGEDRVSGDFPVEVWKFGLPAPPDPNVGINEQGLINTYIYPNPTNDIIKWENDESITELKIYNNLGQLVLSSNSETKQLSTQSLEIGVYFVKFYENLNPVKSTKLLIQR